MKIMVLELAGATASETQAQQELTLHSRPGPERPSRLVQAI